MTKKMASAISKFLLLKHLGTGGRFIFASLTTILLSRVDVTDDETVNQRSGGILRNYTPMKVKFPGGIAMWVATIRQTFPR
jgi:hypothetical protein